MQLMAKYWAYRQLQFQKAILQKKYGKFFKLAKKYKESYHDAGHYLLTQTYKEFFETGIKSVVKTDYNCQAENEKGEVLRFWCGNKHYSYATNTQIKKDGKVTSHRESQMPEWWCRFAIDELIENHPSARSVKQINSWINEENK